MPRAASSEITVPILLRDRSAMLLAASKTDESISNVVLMQSIIALQHQRIKWNLVEWFLGIEHNP